MSKKALLILAPTGYQDVEYNGTRAELEKGGCEIVVASGTGGTARGKFGGTVERTLPLADVSVGDFDAIVFIGGPGAEAYVSHPEALRIAHETVRAEILLGAICVAPLILAKAKVLDGRRATVWDDGQGTQAKILQKAGAQYTGDQVTRDGKIVTGNGPEAAAEFGRTIVELLRA